MALLWFDGFGGYESVGDGDRLDNIDNVGASFGAYGRRSGRGLLMDAVAECWYEEVSGTPDTIIFGRAVYINSGTLPTYSASYPIFSLYDAFPPGNIHLKFHINSSRLIEVRDNADALIATTSGQTIEGTTWYYIEVKVKISDTVGQITININEIEVLSTSADKDTQNGSNAYIQSIRTAGVYNALPTYFDDFYICDTSGSKNNNFLGDIRVDIVRPDGAGAHTDFTPSVDSSAGNNWENVDEEYGPDDDTTYNDGGSVGNKDSYGLPALPSPAGTEIFGVKDQITVRKTDAGSRKVKIITRQGGSDYLGDEITLSDSYTTHAEIMEDNPDDSSLAGDWDDADISGGEVGVEITA